jgi:hypothetical protein
MENGANIALCLPGCTRVHSVADSDPGSGLGKKSRSGSAMNIPGHISESLESIFWVKNT